MGSYGLSIRILAALMMLTTSVGHAQIVNVQGAIAKPPVENGIEGRVALKLGWTEGNAPSFDVGGSGSVVWKHDDSLTLAMVSGEYGSAMHVVNTKKTFAHLRERYTLSSRWRWEAFAQHEYDRFRRLSFRALLGTGPALQIIDDENHSLLVGAAYMLDVEKLDKRVGEPDSGVRMTEHRASTYVTGRQRITADVSFVQTIYAQPRLDELDNYRLLADASLIVQLSERIALTDGFVASYDSRPPEQVKRWDTTLRLGLILTL